MLPNHKLLKEAGLDSIVIAFANTPEQWPLKAEAAGLFCSACEIAARLSSYDEMLRACAKMTVLAAELQSPVLLDQAKQIYAQFELETEARPIFKTVSASEVN